ncbi:MAG: DUF1801 domain-containing protein [Ignavibacteria bacterium]|nr:DUF1801 domain-containing protein [Ignavibacteria bacterium]
MLKKVKEKPAAASGGIFDSIPAPARRALIGKGIDSLVRLSKHSKEDLLKLHGFGPSSIPAVESLLKSAGLSLAKKQDKANRAGGFADVDEYISSQPAELIPVLNELRRVILKSVPGAEEFISYQLPSYRYFGIVIHFGGFKKHYSIFLRPKYLQEFLPELSAYRTTKSAVNFPLGSPVPVKLISKIAKYVADRNRLEAKAKEAQKKSKK